MDGPDPESGDASLDNMGIPFLDVGGDEDAMTAGENCELLNCFLSLYKRDFVIYACHDML